MYSSSGFQGQTLKMMIVLNLFI